MLALAGVVLLAVTALAAVWLLGQLLTGLGLFIVGAAGVLGRLMWFLLITGILAGVVYFVSSAWRPSVRTPLRPVTPPRPAARRAARGRAGKQATPTPVPPAPARATPIDAEPVQAPAATEPDTTGPVRSGG
ncbi:hypothetical protein GCM10008960_09800 [Deinococcus sedimenti]|uniref:Uncharacterized protein n=1 Tax=Deinococcus sedimenti TaxID=1867090 RepID=A0ABQ2S2R0_9DEIO|nr:hypothetical protein GCM10008960_09800 [Deinococcus sedimenti]